MRQYNAPIQCRFPLIPISLETWGLQDYPVARTSAATKVCPRNNPLVFVCF